MADRESLALEAEPDIAALIAARPNLRMDPTGGLVLEGVPLATIARDLGTPTWVYGAGTIRARLAALRDALSGAGLGQAHIHYAVKANDHLAILAIMAAEGAGADVVSAGELRRALQAGIPASRIVFSGVGKTVADLRLAVSEGIAQINVESREELAMLSAVAEAAGRVVDLVIRVNPDVDAETHAKITTGKAENKFGIAWAEAEAVYAYAATLPGLRPRGLAVHIGSQILSLAPFRAAFARVAELVTRLRTAGHAVDRVDCGGGIGIPYGAGAAPSLDGFAAALAETLGGLGLDLMLEPGRWLLAPAGVLLAAVVLAKQTGARHFIVLDAAMNDLVRPAMYDAWHGIVPVSAADAAGPLMAADIVGPVCETGDTFARDRSLPRLRPEALVAILDAGAYGAVMSSTYNARPLAAAALVDGTRSAVISPRQEIAALWSRETVPEWLSDAAAPSPLTRRGWRRPDRPKPVQRPRGRLPRRLVLWRRAARSLLIYEAVWPILWPPAGILGAYLCAALLGLPQRLGRPLNTLLLVGDVALAAAWLGAAIWRLRWPDDAAARRRLQTASGLAHDPIAALEDSPAQTDAASLAIWQMHRARSMAAARHLRLRLPWPWRTRRDRLLFRGGLVAALLVCALVAGPAWRDRLGAAFSFDFALLLGGPATPPAVTAWVTPPAYTGRAPLLLPGHDAALTLPAGSRLTVTVSGVHRAPRLAGVDAAFEELDANSYQLNTALIRGGLLTLRGGGERLARWTLTVLTDQPPTIAFAGEPGPEQGSANLRLPWRGTDDYGVVSAEMQAHLVGRPAAPALTLPLTLPEGPAPAVSAVQVADLTANPWAGLPVAMRLTDRDASGQEGGSPVLTLTLPERRFADPAARAVIAIRKGLVLMPDPQDATARAAAAQAIFEAGAAAVAAGKSAEVVLPLMATGWQMVDARGAATVPAAIDQLWQVALHFEQGEAADTAQALERANDALKNALQSPSTTPADLARLIQAVQAAVLQHLSTLMQMAQHQGGAIGSPAGARPLDLSQLARQMRAMEAAAQAGDVQAMRRDLAALEQSLQALEQARVVKPDPAQAAARAQAMKDLASLQSMMRSQAQLMDHSARRAEAEAPDPAGDARDAQAQAQLRQALSSLSARLGPSIDGAGRAMGQAVQQLQANQDAGASAAQQKAVLALQQAANALGQRLSQQGGQSGAMQIGGLQPGEQPGGQDGLSQGSGETDPLGRPLSTGQGASLGADVAIPNGSGQARLRAILQELRNKAGDRSLTPAELDYIERLLQPF